MIIGGILLLCLFPLWPYTIKLLVFYFSLYSLIAISIFSIIRFIIFYLFRIAGFEFWILPEIFENDSFRPYYTFKRLDDGLTCKIIRVCFFIATLLWLSFVYLVPSSYEGLGDILVNSYDEVVDWGRDKILFDFTKDISNKTITYESFVDDEEEEIE